MATQKGIITLGGSTDGLTFYKAYGKDLVRKTNGPTKDQIASGANFQRTRENNCEFGGCSKISKSFRTSLFPLKSLTDGQFGNRVTKVLKFLIAKDVGVPGERPVKLSSHREALADFECNITHKLSKSIPGTFTTHHNPERTLASITIPGGQIEAIQAPDGATHFQLIHALGVVSDFTYDGESKRYVPEEPALDTRGNVQYSDYFSLEGANVPEYTSTISLPGIAPLPDAVSVLHALGITFFQKIGSVQYPLKQVNALKIVEVF